MYFINYEMIKDKNPVIIDCRFDMSAPKKGYEAYLKGHLKGAFYMDLEDDMTAPVEKHGGRHPSKSLDVFLEKIKSFGIDKSSQVLIYDDGTLAMASRLWFMLKLIGLKDIYILKGGYLALIENDMPMTDELPKNSDSLLKLDLQSHLMCSVEDVKKAQCQDHVVIVDAREEKRYLGLEEPIDFVAGHIPSSVNYFWQDTLNQDFSPEEHFKNLRKYKTIINHCGSGVTACVNMFFMAEAKIDSLLYLGSYSDWISYKDHEIIVKNNKVIKVSEANHEDN